MMTSLATSVPSETALANPPAPRTATPRSLCLDLAPLPPGVKAKPNTPKLLQRDLKTLAIFIRIYCEAHHPNRAPVDLKGYDIAKITGKTLCLCPECSKLLQHAFVKRTHCVRDPKPSCKHCPSHCYAKNYRQKIREVMRFSGKRLLLSGRLDYLFHLFF